IDGSLHAVVVSHGVARRCVVGPTALAAREVELSRFAMRSALSGRSRTMTVEALVSTGERLEASLLGPARRFLDKAGESDLVLVPPARLNAAPWGLLPALSRRPFVVSPSLRAWRHAAERAQPAMRRVALVQGPGLDATGEIPRLTRLHPDA